MPRKLSSIAANWWDYTTLDDDLLKDAAKLTVQDLAQLSRPGFQVVFYDTLEDFYLAEALEYINAWRQATPDNPCGLCGPIGPTEQLPLVARLVNDLGLDLSHAHFWAMDEWVENGRAVPVTHPLSFEKADRELCFDRIKPALRPREEHLHFPRGDFADYSKAWDAVRCVVMQGGQGEIKHWAFNDPPKREGHIQGCAAESAGISKFENAHRRFTSSNVGAKRAHFGRRKFGGRAARAISVGPYETWKAEKVSIWHAGNHDNPFGQRLTAFMISKRLPDAAVPMSLLADHPNVQFNYYRRGIGSCEVEMH